MDKEKDIIKELNIVFKKLEWKLLPENNIYPSAKEYVWVIISSLFIDRSYIPYEKHINKFTIEQLDEYVVEFIKNICLKYGLNEIRFNSLNHRHNSIKIK